MFVPGLIIGFMVGVSTYHLAVSLIERFNRNDQQKNDL